MLTRTSKVLVSSESSTTSTSKDSRNGKLKKEPIFAKQNRERTRAGKQDRISEIRRNPNFTNLQLNGTNDINFQDSPCQTVVPKNFFARENKIDLLYKDYELIVKNAFKHYNDMHPPAAFFETGKQNRKPKQLQFDELLKKSKISLESAKPPEPNLPTYELLQQRELLLDKKHAAPIVKTRRWRVCLDEDKMKLVQRTLFDRNATSDLPGALCEACDFQTLRPATWLNDNVVNFYGVMINIRGSKYEKIPIESRSTLLSPGDPGFLRSHCFSSFFMTKYDKDGFNGVKRWSKKVDLFQKDVIIFPVNINNTHWTCAAINLRQKRFEFYDSMGNENKHVLDNLKDYIQNEHLAKRKVELDTLDWDYCYTKPPQQNNGYDCGVFVCQFMDCLSRDWGGGDTVFDFSQQNLPYIRNKVVYEISTREFLEEKWS